MFRVNTGRGRSAGYCRADCGYESSIDLNHNRQSNFLSLFRVHLGSGRAQQDTVALTIDMNLS